MSSAVPMAPSGPGWFLARVSTMKAWFAGTWSGVLASPSGPRVRSGSSARSGTKTVLPLLTVWSTPWSKNWPKNVNHELYGGERPTSVVTFGMKSVLCDGVQPAGTPGVGVGAVVGSVVHASELAVGSWLRTGWPAAATAAGFVDVWSTTRLLMTRGCWSKTLPDFDLYDVASPAPGKPVGTGSASRKVGVVRRGNNSSDAANRPRSGKRLLHEPSTVRRPYGVRRSGIWSGSGPTSVPHGLLAVRVAVCRSAILICFMMKCRSPAVTVNPWPGDAAAACARLGRTTETETAAISAIRNSAAETATVLWNARHQNRWRKWRLLPARCLPDMVG